MHQQNRGADLTAIPAPQSSPKSMVFHLPVMPVPLSACFVNNARRGRVDSKRYKAFKARVDMHLFVQRLRGKPDAALFTGPVWVTYIVSRPDKRCRDLSNLLKALDDTLARNFILQDDSQIVDLRIGWTLEKLEHPVLVQIQEA